MNKLLLISLIGFITIANTNLVKAQSKKETFDFIVYMIEKQNFFLNDLKDPLFYTRSEVISYNYSLLTIDVVDRSEYYDKCSYCINYRDVKYTINLDGIGKISDDPINSAGSAGGFSVYFTSKTKTKITEITYYNDGRTSTDLINYKSFEFKKRSDAIKFHKALVHMKTFSGFNPDLF